MLKKDKSTLFFIIVLMFFSSCMEEKAKKSYYEVSKNIAGDPLYMKNYLSLKDSILNWYNSLSNFEFMKLGQWELDSLQCYNKEVDRFVTCIKCKCQKDPSCNADDLHSLYGAKIKGKWYFFLGGTTIYLPRKVYQKNIRTPLNFQKIHEIALKEIFGGYLTSEGEINENYFKQEFENSGWGVISGKKEDFERAYLEKVNNNWYWRDTSSKKELIP